ncbi:hypothetical protein O0L34_g3786 [Tuta absoluta]|nr:hypothetical protein O0L34_g3786 [Tuta absoluta]
MSRLGFYLLCGALCGLVVLGQGDVPKLPETVTITVPSKTTEAPVTTTEHTTTPSTTTISTTPATTTPTSTTPVPPPTTTSTTHAPPPTTPPTTTTPVPPTTTTPAPKPTPPAPVPPPSQGTWSLQQNNKTCIVVQFAAQLNVTYTKAENSCK